MTESPIIVLFLTAIPFTHQLHYCQNEWTVAVSSKAELTSTEELFRLWGRLEVNENGKLIFSRQWNPTIPRKIC